MIVTVMNTRMSGPASQEYEGRKNIICARQLEGPGTLFTMYYYLEARDGHDPTICINATIIHFSCKLFRHVSVLLAILYSDLSRQLATTQVLAFLLHPLKLLVGWHRYNHPPPHGELFEGSVHSARRVAEILFAKVQSRTKQCNLGSTRATCAATLHGCAA